MGGSYGESLVSGHITAGVSPGPSDYERSNGSEEPRTINGRPGKNVKGMKGWAYVTEGEAVPKKDIGYNSLDELDDEDEASSSGGEWDGGDDDGDDNMPDVDDEDDRTSEEDGLDGEPEEKKSLVVVLRYGKKPENTTGANATAAPTEHAQPQESQLSSQAQANSSPIPQRPSVKPEEPIVPTVNTTAHAPSPPTTSYSSSITSPAQSKPEQARPMANGTLHPSAPQAEPQAFSGMKPTPAAPGTVPTLPSTAAPTLQALPLYPYEVTKPQHTTIPAAKEPEPAAAGYQNPFTQATAPAKPVSAPVSST